MGRSRLAWPWKYRVPADWYNDKEATARRRCAWRSIGHGGVFNGGELSPAKEMLLLDTCNWLLGRDDELPTSEDLLEISAPGAGERRPRPVGWARVARPAAAVLPTSALVVVLVRRLR